MAKKLYPNASAATERQWRSSDSSARRDIKTRTINAYSAADQSAGLAITMSISGAAR
jgi:hypothetical protein